MEHAGDRSGSTGSTGSTGSADSTGHDYLSYLIRLLRTQSGETSVWRVSLVEPVTQDEHRFDDLHALFAFLMACTGQAQSDV